MRLIGFVVLLLVAVVADAVAGYRSPSYLSSQNFIRTKDTTEEEVTFPTTIADTTSTSSSKPISASGAPLEITSQKPITTELPPKEESAAAAAAALGENSNSEPASAFPPFPAIEDSDPYKRRVVTYDQRQEGQYNLRADLENFMIVLIPPSATDGLGLLEQLTKSTFRRNSHATKGKRKQYSSSTSLTPESLKYRAPFKSSHYRQAGGHLPSPGHLSIVDGSGLPVHHSPEYIEGRTPYHVDISANDNEQARLQPDRQVDVLPPPYSLAYQHLIKPVHLEAEPTVIQALPPSDLNAFQTNAENFLETYNQILASSLQGDTPLRTSNSNANDGYYRVSRAIRANNLLDSINRIPSSNSLDFGKRIQPIPSTRTQVPFGPGHLYPPIDVPAFWTYLTGMKTKSRIGNDDNDQKLEESQNDYLAPWSEFATEDDYQSTLNAAKTLFGEESVERCAPGRRRDSYGICREISGY